MDRPYVLASVAMSLDGYIDDAGPDTLVLSDTDDLDRVDAVRAGVDAFLVGVADREGELEECHWQRIVCGEWGMANGKAGRRTLGFAYSLFPALTRSPSPSPSPRRRTA